MSDRDVTLVIAWESIEKATAQAVADMLGENHRDAPMRKRLRDEVNRQVQGLDVRDIVRQEIAEQLPGIVETVVESMLAAEVKRRGKAMLGDLLAQMEILR